MDNKELNICIASDDNYAEHMHVAIFSIIYNLDKDCICNVYILDWWISETKKKRILDMQNKFWNLNIKFLEINDPKYEKFDTPLSKETFFRIDAPYIFSELDELIYMDCDMIANLDISELSKIDLWNNLIWVAKDMWAYCAFKYMFHIPSEFWYFNAWFMIMNLKLMRKEKIPEKVFKYLADNQWKPLVKEQADQLALNVLCYDRKYILPLKYNATPLAFQPINWNFSKDEYHEAKRNPVIIHYACAKPRNKRCFHPKRKLYHKYRNLAWLSYINYPKWFDFPRLRKSILEVIWNFLIAAIPSNIYYHLVWKPKMFLSKFIKF